MSYHAPLDDLRFAIRVNGHLDEILTLPSCADLDIDTVDAILEEAAKFAQDSWADSNAIGDQFGTKLIDGNVIHHPIFKEVYQDFCDTGWISLHMPVEYGGQGLPTILSTACEEMWYAGNLALSLLPMLSNGATNAINLHASAELKQKFLPKMIDGSWSGTMNLTEPQAGSDLGKITCKAIPDGDNYLISGQKIFITWGDHQLTENIVHLVLARLPNAAVGTKGISLFIIPKYLVNDDGTLGERNSVYASSLEHKLGIHGSPTCVMQFEQAKGYLVGKASFGMIYMFTMMSMARLGVGIEGIAVSERAFQAAKQYAHERIQGNELGATEAVSIIHHPDVKRMLLIQKATIEAERALYLSNAAYLDKSFNHPNPEERTQAKALADFMIPIIKTFHTENSTLLTNLAIQVFGGMGYIEETGVAQYMRDARITPIYEGTNGIQALDFIGRKTGKNKGKTALYFLHKGRSYSEKLAPINTLLAENLHDALNIAESTLDYILNCYAENKIKEAATGSLPYLMLFSTVLGAIEMSKAYLAASEALKDIDNADFAKEFYLNKIATVTVYFEHVLPNIYSYNKQIQHGAHSILDIDVNQI